MWMVPPEGMRRLKVAVTCSVRRATVSWMREEAAAVPPSTARKALVMATVILSSVYGTTVPLRLITRSWPGAVALRSWAASAAAGTTAGGFSRVVSVCMEVSVFS
ncbi:hypothetical protein D9M68_261190 [compost metagenome]